jgi:GNAT superfamily N-acetyltransferase
VEAAEVSGGSVRSTIVVRAVEGDDDIATYIAVRNRVHPQTPILREIVVDDHAKPDHLDLIAELDGEPVGAASTETFGGAPNGDLAFLSIRVIAEARRRRVGSALHRRCSEHARQLGKARFYVLARHVDADSLGYYASLGYQEVGRMQDVSLDLASADPVLPDVCFEIRPAAGDTIRGAYEVALEADADIPSGETIDSGTFEQWRDRHFGPLTIPDLSFVAIEDGRVIGYAICGLHDAETAGHWMTGVARSARGRGVALALKQTQVVAAKAGGWKALRTQNDLSNLPMRRVNEKLGYVPLLEWVHLTGPLIA